MLITSPGPIRIPGVAAQRTGITLREKDLMLSALKVPGAMVFAACLTGMNGCALLPPALQQGYALLSGISYLATSKGPADHVISVAMNEDCVPLRILIGKAMCVPASARTNRPLLVTLSDVLQPEPSDPHSGKLFTEFPAPEDFRIEPGSAIAQTY